MKLKKHTKSIRISDTDLMYVNKMIKELDEVKDFSSLFRFLLYNYKENQSVNGLEKEIKKLNTQHEISRESFNIYLEYLASNGEGIDSEALYQEAKNRIDKRRIKTRTKILSQKFSKKKKK